MCIRDRIGTMVVGGLIGFTLAKKVEMTQMPELVAILHSLVGLAAMFVGYANFLSHATEYIGIEKRFMISKLISVF